MYKEAVSLVQTFSPRHSQHSFFLRTKATPSPFSLTMKLHQAVLLFVALAAAAPVAEPDRSIVGSTDGDATNYKRSPDRSIVGSTDGDATNYKRSPDRSIVGSTDGDATNYKRSPDRSIVGSTDGDATNYRRSPDRSIVGSTDGDATNYKVKRGTYSKYEGLDPTSN
jgi:hypothetical protein